MINSINSCNAYKRIVKNHYFARRHYIMDLSFFLSFKKKEKKRKRKGRERERENYIQSYFHLFMHSKFYSILHFSQERIETIFFTIFPGSSIRPREHARAMYFAKYFSKPLVRNTRQSPTSAEFQNISP